MKSGTHSLPPLQSPRLLDRVRERACYLHYSIRTEQACVHWVRAFVRFPWLAEPGPIGLRVKDVDFEHRALVMHEGKGAKDRVVMLPATA